MNVKAKDVDNLIKTFDADNNKKIDITEFFTMMNVLFRKDELKDIYKKYAPKYDGNDSKPYMSLNELLNFLKTEQKDQHTTLKQLRFMSEKLKKVGADEAIIHFDDFAGYLFSNINSVFDPEHQHEYQVNNQNFLSFQANGSAFD
jgi:Ca2+-binding EF-hand superfamily protein